MNVPEDFSERAPRVRRVARMALHDLEEHPARILEEPLRSSVDVVVAPGIGPANNHHHHTGVVVNAKVANRGLKQVRVCRKPEVF